MPLVGWIVRTALAGTRQRVALLSLGSALGILTGLVASGALTSVDQYGLDHLMPGLHPGQKATHSSRGLYLPFSSDTNWWSKLLDIWTYPCSVVVSALVLVIVGIVLWRRARSIAGLVWIAAWVVANGIEVVGKWLLSRPAVYGTSGDLRIHVSTFDHAYPSGHTARCAIVAGAVVFAWRHLVRPVLYWALLVPPFLVLSAAHTPTDVIGGAMLGLIVVLVAWPLASSPQLSDSERPSWRE